MSTKAAQALPERTPYALDQPLPTAVVAGQSVWPGYRRYPVFGWRWFKGRSLIFTGVIVAYAALAGLGTFMETHSVYRTLMAMLYFAAAFILMSTAGPFLAAVVRHARLPLPRERLSIVLAMLLGVSASAFADYHASNYLVSSLPEIYESDGAAAKVTAIGVMASILFYGAFGGGLALRAYFREVGRWQQSHLAQTLSAIHAQKQQADLRLSVLQAQVEPHFLFNTLALVRASVRQQPEQAEATLDALVDYLRASIPRMRDDEAALHSTLGQQVDLCASYLELMRLRTDDRLRYGIPVEPALRERPFPPMLLITLVENAIKHGIEPKPGAGHVEIVAEIVVEHDAEALRVRVIDDGLGLQPGIGGGLGLANVRAQLETRFAGRARLDLRSAPGGGTVAELSVPLGDENEMDMRVEATTHRRDDGAEASA